MHLVLTPSVLLCGLRLRFLLLSIAFLEVAVEKRKFYGTKSRPQAQKNVFGDFLSFVFLGELFGDTCLLRCEKIVHDILIMNFGELHTIDLENKILKRLTS